MTAVAGKPTAAPSIRERILSRMRPRAGYQDIRSWWWRDPTLVRLVVPCGAFGVGAAAVFTGALSLSVNSLDFLRLPLMLLLFVAAVALVLYWRHQASTWDRATVGLGVLALVGAVWLWLWPEYYYGHDINGIIHRSLLMSVLLLAIGLPVLCNALFWVLGGTPTAWDTSRYPMLMFPIALVLFIYGALLWRVLQEGFPGLGLDVVTTAYDVSLEGGERSLTPGLSNHILGTLLLIFMTAVFALPVGVGAGVCMAESDGWLATIIGFCTQMLRAISIFILGVLAFTIADWAANYDTEDWRSQLFRGFYRDDQGFKIAGHGSFLTASLIMALVVVPVIARATVEGFRSIPREIREGSVALGATDGHAFLFLMLPWAIPNIITGLLLGCAEAAGSVAILLFIAGSGEYGVGPLREVTSLAFLVYYADRTPIPDFREAMLEYQYTAALLLLTITFALSIAAVVLKQKFGARYRGASANQ